MSARRMFALALLGAAAAQANTPADYAYTFPIETSASAGSAWRIELTPAVYAWTQDAAVRDIEVFNADGRAVPFARITPAPATARIREAVLPLLAVPASVAATATASDLHLIIERDPTGRLRRIDAGEHTPADASRGTREWLLDASALEHPLDALELDWRAPAAGVIARFDVEGSDDLENWHAIGSGSVLALDQDGAHLARHDIALGGARAKYLRLRRLDEGVDLLGLGTRARWRDGSEAPARTWLVASNGAAPGIRNEPAPATGVTRFAYSLPAALPIDAARIELAGDNSLAPLILSAHVSTQPEAAWRELAHVTAFRLRADGEPLRNGDIELANVWRLRDWRIESHAPLSAPPRLSVAMRADAFVFLAEGRAPFMLAAGSAHAHHADYPLDVALANLRMKFGKDWQPPQATLGAAQVSAGEAALKPVPAPLPWRRWLLWAVLVAGAAAVGGFALSLLRATRT